MKSRIFIFALALFSPLISNAAECTSMDKSECESYWNSKNLFSQSRLGEQFDGFESGVQRKQTGKEAEAYLAQIREEIAGQKLKQQQGRDTIINGQNTPESALRVTYVEKGFIRVAVQAKSLFDENTAAFRAGSMDILSRLSEILHAKEGQRVEVTLVNEIDDLANVRDVDAERALLFFSLVNFKRQSFDADSAS